MCWRIFCFSSSSHKSTSMYSNSTSLSFRNCLVILHQTHVLSAYKITLCWFCLPGILESCMVSLANLCVNANITVYLIIWLRVVQTDALECVGKSFINGFKDSNSWDYYVKGKEGRRRKEEKNLLREEREKSQRSQEVSADLLKNFGRHLPSWIGSNSSSSPFSNGIAILDTKPCRL